MILTGLLGNPGHSSACSYPVVARPGSSISIQTGRQSPCGCAPAPQVTLHTSNLRAAGLPEDAAVSLALSGSKGALPAAELKRAGAFARGSSDAFQLVGPGECGTARLASTLSSPLPISFSVSGTGCLIALGQPVLGSGRRTCRRVQGRPLAALTGSVGAAAGSQARWAHVLKPPSEASRQCTLRCPLHTTAAHYHPSHPQAQTSARSPG